MANRLAGQTSPYLRQHADDPVEWYPWGDEAFEEARRSERPILLSVGYASCHWCHVMQRESFRDPATAEAMNRDFVNVKVDREERPDVDAVHMAALQAMTGQGGWPMTVALTPDGEPWFAGTYFPPEDRMGHPSFRRVLAHLAGAWAERRDEVVGSAGRIRAALAQAQDLPPAEGALAPSVTDAAEEALASAFDAEHGGFGGAPKFPPHGVLAFLLRRPGPRAEAMAAATLDAMADGGIHDLLGGGFARYSVDERWEVPHFEKMLYDNAQLLSRYAEAVARGTGAVEEARGTGSGSLARWRADAARLVGWLEREMLLPGGAFASALDADSEGEEGRFYAWTAEAFDAAFEPDAEGARTPVEDGDAAFARAVWGVAGVGRFEGRHVLRRARDPEDAARALGLDPAAAPERLERVRARLSEVRERRVRPARDDKALASWNGLALSGLADAARLLGDERARGLALGAARFLRERMRGPDGRLRHAWSPAGGEARVGGLLEDVALVGLGALDLYRATWDPAWLRWGLELADEAFERFRDPEGPGFFDTADDAEALVVRPKGWFDAATPSGNGAAALLLARAARLSGRSELEDAARGAVAPVLQAMERHPHGFGTMLLAADELLRPPREIAIVGERGRPEVEAMLREVERRPLAGVAVARSDGPDDPLAELLPFLEGRGAPEGGAAAYVCEGFACRRPVTEVGELVGMLEELEGGRG